MVETISLLISSCNSSVCFFSFKSVIYFIKNSFSLSPATFNFSSIFENSVWILFSLLVIFRSSVVTFFCSSENFNSSVFKRSFSKMVISVDAAVFLDKSSCNDSDKAFKFEIILKNKENNKTDNLNIF